MKKFLLVILDGAAENCMTRPAGRSALAAAKKPYIDMLAANSTCGLWSGPHAPHYNVRSLSGVATLEILGYSWKNDPGRGYLEALGMGIMPRKDSVCVRGNFAFVKKGVISDRRAGRDENGLDDMVRDINKKIKSIEGVKIRIHRLVGHRIVLILTGGGLSRHVTDCDIGSRPAEIRHIEAKARKTARILNEFLRMSHQILSCHPSNRKRKVPTNFILLRSAGARQNVKSFRSSYGMRACSISGVNIIRGVSTYLGIDVIKTLLTQIEDDLASRVRKAASALDKYDFVILHINGADTCGHDKNFAAKVRYIEKIDREVFSHITKLRHINIAVISDHITDSRTGEHVFGPVPFMIYSAEDENGENHVSFDGKSCMKGFIADNPMKKFLSV